MKKLCAIGEALIDFIPQQKGKRLKDVEQFKRVAGGAPANVAAAVAKLGGASKFLSKLSTDAFGDYIFETIQKCGIDTSSIVRCDEYDTSLAFVSLASDGNRDFKFFRKQGADLQYSVSDLSKDVLEDCGMIHFCSVSLVESPMKKAHQKLIEMAIEKQVKISFDPNLRRSLWDDDEGLRKTVNEFLPYADILKISDEELSFITGYSKIEEAFPTLFAKRCQLLIYTLGKDGAIIYRRDGSHIDHSGYQVEVKDTTGAGDSFIGAFIYQLLQSDFEDYQMIDDESLSHYLDFANAYAAYMTTKEGALAAMASMSEFKKFLNQID